MAGVSESSENLNMALYNAVSILDELDCEWFVFYGTLLGLVRDGFCIDGDDDVDIMVNCDMNRLGVLLHKHGFRTNPRDRGDILKTYRNRLQNFASVDFYFCLVEGNDWFATIDRNWVRDVKIEQIDFEDRQIYVPDRREERLEQMYGPDWTTPIRGKKVGQDKSIT